MSGAAVARCEGCGREVAGGSSGCRAEFDALCARDYSGAVPYPLHRLMVDAYCLQHPAEFCASGKSYAAHLVGLLVAQEFDGDAGAQRALRAWLDGDRQLPRPVEPVARGERTIADVIATEAGEARERALRAWAAEVWRAYTAQHETARAWLAEARGSR